MEYDHSPKDHAKTQLLRHQQILADLLREDLEMSFVILKQADSKNAEPALARARTALEAVRHQVPHISAIKVRTEIQARADELEVTVDKFGT